MSRLRGRRSRGQSLAEFALVLPIFLLIVMALFDIGRGVFIYNGLTNAAREAARLAIVNQDKAMVAQRAQEMAFGTQITNSPSNLVNFYRGTPNTDDVTANPACDNSDASHPIAVGCIAVVRTQAGIAAGELAGMLVTLHTGSARTDHFHLLNGSVPRLLDECVAVARLLAAVVAGMEVEPERWARAAREGFTAAADVADVLAVEAGLDYRTAHHVVGRAVRDLVEAGSYRRMTSGFSRRVIISRPASSALLKSSNNIARSRRLLFRVTGL